MQINQKKGGVALSYIAMVLNVLIKFLYTPILLRLLGQAEFGLYSLVVSIVGYLAILDFGFGSTVSRYVVKYKTANDRQGMLHLYGTLSVIYILIGIIALLICMGLNLGADTLFGKSMTCDEIYKLRLMIVLCGINLLFSFPLQISVAVLTAYERFVFKNGIHLAKIIGEPVVMLLLLYFFHAKSVGAIVVITLFNLFGYLAYYIYAIKKLDFKFALKYYDHKLLKTLVAFSANMFALMLFEQAQFNSGQFILGMSHGTEIVAIWGIVMVFVLNFRSISTSVTNVFMPSFMTNVFKNDQDETNSLVIRMTRYQTYVILFIFLNFALLGRSFITIWAGNQYSEAYEAAFVIMAPMCFSLLLEFCYMYQVATKNLSYRIITFYVCLFLSFILIYMLKGISILSFSWAISLSINLGQVVCVLYYVYKRTSFSINEWFNTVVRISFAPVILTACMYFFDKFVLYVLIQNSICHFVLLAIVFNILLCSCMWIFSIDRQDKNRIIIKNRRL